MNHVILVFLGGGTGAALRHFANGYLLRLLGAGFPYGTIFVNIVGSLLMGLLIGWITKRTGTSTEIRLLLATGFLGGFTTFSAFSLDVANLWERGAPGLAFGYAIASVMISILALFFGLWLVRSLA